MIVRVIMIDDDRVVNMRVYVSDSKNYPKDRNVCCTIIDVYYDCK